LGKFQNFWNSKLLFPYSKIPRLGSYYESREQDSHILPLSFILIWFNVSFPYSLGLQIGSFLHYTQKKASEIEAGYLTTIHILQRLSSTKTVRNKLLINGEKSKKMCSIRCSCCTSGNSSPPHPPHPTQGRCESY
jgi:hypothetical protein